MGRVNTREHKIDVVGAYVRDVLGHLAVAPAERERIEADVRAHLAEALEQGLPPEAAVARLGPAAELAAGYVAGYLARYPLRYAGFWRRLAAFALDLAIMLVVAGVPAVAAAVASGWVPAHPEAVVPGAPWAGWLLGGGLVVGELLTILSVLGVILFYFPLLEGRSGQTPGKRLLGLRVLGEDGLPINYRQAFIRRISFYFEILPIDALFIPFSPRRQRAFDQVARTVVVHANQ